MSVKMSDTIDYCCSLKGVFVEHQLAEMIKKVNTDVQELKYEYKSDGFAVTDETVIELVNIEKIWYNKSYEIHK